MRISFDNYCGIDDTIVFVLPFFKRNLLLKIRKKQCYNTDTGKKSINQPFLQKVERKMNIQKIVSFSLKVNLKS